MTEIAATGRQRVSRRERTEDPGVSSSERVGGGRLRQGHGEARRSASGTKALAGAKRLDQGTIRRGTPADAEALHTLISTHLTEGHLLPRDLPDLTRHANRFVVCDGRGEIRACAELAPLSSSVAEVRSLVVARTWRGSGAGTRLVDELRDGARRAGFETLCAFTHDAKFFVRQGFSIVPHLWIPEKIATNCLGCPLFRRCGQYAMILPLHRAASRSTASADTRSMAVA
jgi:N-acetylglutamate synthase-like GNAT family acetyltransferase